MNPKKLTLALATLALLNACATLKLVRPDAQKCKPTNSLYGGCAISCTEYEERKVISIPQDAVLTDSAGNNWACQDYSLARIP